MGAAASVLAGPHGSIRVIRPLTAGLDPAFENGERLERATDGLVR